MTVRSILTQCALDLLETESSVTVDQIVGCAYQNHRPEFVAEQERMVWNAARDVAKDVMRRMSEDDSEQMRLPGIGLPSTIAVPTGDGFIYVRADKATWAVLVAGRTIRSGNVSAAVEKLDRYDNALRRLQPFMEGTARTVADALPLLTAAGAA